MPNSRAWSWRRVNTMVARAAGVAAGATSLAQSSSDQWWTGYGNGVDNSRNFASRQIDKANVTRLEVAWTDAYGETGSSPIVVRGVVYGRGRNGGRGARPDVPNRGPLGWVAYALPGNECPC